MGATIMRNPTVLETQVEVSVPTETATYFCTCTYLKIIKGGSVLARRFWTFLVQINEFPYYV